MAATADIAMAGASLIGCSTGNGNAPDENASEGEASADSVTPYSDGPSSMEDVVAKLIEGYDLEEFSDEDKGCNVNLGHYDCDHMAAAGVGEYTGIFKALGLNVAVTGNGNVPEAMSAGQMDMAYCGWTTTLGAVANGVPLFIAAENHTGGSEYLVCSNEIKKPEDLIGKRISIGTEPETTNLNWAEWTDQLGIPLNSAQYDTYAMKDSEEYLALSTRCVGNVGVRRQCNGRRTRHARRSKDGFSMANYDSSIRVPANGDRLRSLKQGLLGVLVIGLLGVA